MSLTRRTLLALPALPALQVRASAATLEVHRNVPAMVEADGRLRLDFGDELMVLPDGLQPSLLCMKSGDLLVQAQINAKPVDTTRMHYPFALATAVSRDAGKTWTNIPLPPNENGLNLEGGVVQLRNGEIVALDTYVTPGKGAGQGVGQIYTSTDEWRTVKGPVDASFDLPGIDFYASSDDGGRPHAAERAHRRILELPNGDLVATLYGQMQEDRTPSAYRATMMKARSMLVRSKDRGRSWKLQSTVAVDPAVGTEGFGEPVIAHLSSGKHNGRLLCFMRTGRELYEAFSDDGGNTWSKPRPRTFANLDINRTELWVDMFRKVKGRTGLLDEKNQEELKGSVVDPDLFAMRGGILAAAFGIRIPQQLCWPNYQHPWNGNYLAFSLDGGETWPNVVRLTSGVPTTHYMAIEETPAGELFVTYDYGFWRHPQRYIYGRTVKVTIKDRA